MKYRLKLLLDALMLGTYLYLMGYGVFGNLKSHAVHGAAFLVMAVIHNALNYRWYLGLFRGRYNKRRLALAVTNVLLLAATFALALSSYHVAGMAGDFGFGVVDKFDFEWLGTHFLAAKIGLGLILIHAALHLPVRF